MTIHRDLLASCWTWAGDVGPGDADLRSPVPLERRIEALVASGWSGAGIDHADLLEFRDRYGLDRVRTMMDDAGITRLELEFLRGWWSSGELRRAADRKLDEFLDAAATLGVQALKVGAWNRSDAEPDEPERGRYEEEFRRTAERAGRFGVSLALEAMSNTNLPTFPEAVDFIRAVDTPWAGLAVDNHQLAKSGDGDFSALPRLLEGVRVVVVELGDSTVDNTPGAPNHGVGPRCIPGTGQLDIAGFVLAMHDAGWGGHWGVEIIADDLRALPVEEGLAAVADGIHASFDAVDEVLAARRGR